MGTLALTPDSRVRTRRRMKALAPLGRLLFSAIFISSGIGHLTNPEMVDYAASTGLPLAHIAVPLSGVVILVAGIFIVLGVLTRISALAIAVFLVLAALTMHAFWRIDDPMGAQMQMVNFMKNIAMTGGALLLAYFGPGPVSLSHAWRRMRAPRGDARGLPLPRFQE